MSRPMSESLDARRKRVMDAARTALIERGYHDVTLDSVARRARLSKGSLYLYFKDKEDIFAAVLSDVLDRLEEQLRGVPREGSSLACLTRMASEMLAFVDENRDFLIQFSREKPDLCGKRAGTVLQKRFSEHLRFVSGGIARCVREGSVRKHDPALGSLFFISLVRMFMLQNVMGGAKGPLRPKANQLMELFLHGLGGKGAKPHA